MKVNKLIAKGLTLGLLLNSLSVLSYANTDILNRYQTLEGEYITIDDSIEGNLEEIEIFGNTVQDENNLEDIQSVGDLYVDENGNSILDKQGREQYKIEIISQGKNLFNAKEAPISFNWRVNTTLIESDIFRVTPNEGLHDGVAYGEVRVPFKLTRGETYTISAKMTGGASYIICWDANTHSTVAYPVNVPFVAEDILDIKIGMYVKLDTEGTFQIQIEKSNNKTNVVPYESNKIELLLPIQLQKIGDIVDKLYWDNSKGRYLIEKNITNIILDGSDDEDWNLSRGTFSDIYDHFHVIPHRFGEAEGLPGHSNPLLSNRFLCSNKSWINGPHNSITTSNSSYTQIGMTFDMYYYQTVEDFKNWLKNNPTTVWYQLKNPQIIETNITSKLKIPTYDEKTHIYVDSKNSINPTLKIVVDRLPQIAKNSVEEAKINSSINNISLARMYINMLPESLYKDQLQEQLSEIFSSDMVLDRKTATSNLDLYIKCENILQMSLNTNSIAFEDFSGIEDMTKENAVQISINSSLPYSLNAYLPTEIQNSDKSVAMNKDILNIKENSETTYQTFLNTTDKIVLKDNNQAGNDLIHNIDIKLKGGIAHQKDVYKTTIKFEAEQK